MNSMTSALKPALRLRAGDGQAVIIRTLDEAADFLRGYQSPQRPVLRDGMLHRVEGAAADWQQRDAAQAFRGWAELEGILLGVVD